MVRLSHATITHIHGLTAPSVRAIVNTPLVSGTAPLLHAFLECAHVLAAIGTSVCLLAILLGGLMHTQVFHYPDAPARGTQWIRQALIGLGVMATSTLIIKMTLAL
jgi:hypothetical protein